MGGIQNARQAMDDVSDAGLLHISGENGALLLVIKPQRPLP